MNLKELTGRIDWRAPKYMLPAILYPLLLGAGYFFFDLFDVKLAEKPSGMQTTEYLNPELPQAQLRTDGIGGKYENMAKSYGKIQDYSAVVTIVTERYRTQYVLLYTTRPAEAVTSKEVELSERTAYHNPAVSMSTEEMYRYARQIWTSPARFRNVGSKRHRMTMRLNNIYSAGDYFFLDFSVENRTNIRFDIDEVRLKLSDKKVSKATNSQVVELKPELVLEQSRSFLHGYRNVVVVKKLTFPNDKVLTVELIEKQISGRAISLNIDYEDVLSADGFSSALLTEE